MKKLTALILTLVLALTACTALAAMETWELGDTRLTIDLPADIQELELEREDIEDGAVACMTDRDETLELVVYMNDADWSMKEIEASLKEEDDVTVGYTTVNGIEVLYYTYEEDGIVFLGYIVIDSGVEVEIAFWFETEDGGNLSKTIMETLTRN